MSYRKPLLDILREIHESLEFPVTIISATNSGNTWTITVDNVYHAQPGYIITIDGNEYRITDVDDETNVITATGTEAILATSFEMYGVQFYHGTPISANNEIDKISDPHEKTPMIYVMESFEENWNDDIESIVERTVSPRIFCLTSADFAKWKISEFEQKALRPMMRLVDNFREAIMAYPRTDFEGAGSRSIPHYRFGVYISNRGTEKSLFVDNLSGIEFVPSLTFYKPQDQSCQML